eukprot:15203380-Alexandrium_andersonii.AAC.1
MCNNSFKVFDQFPARPCGLQFLDAPALTRQPTRRRAEARMHECTDEWMRGCASASTITSAR